MSNSDQEADGLRDPVDPHAILPAPDPIPTEHASQFHALLERAWSALEHGDVQALSAHVTRMGGLCGALDHVQKSAGQHEHMMRGLQSGQVQRELRGMPQGASQPSPILNG